MSKLLKRGLILHYTEGSIYYGKDGSSFQTKAEMVDNVNVLGCGDFFASSFINQSLLGHDVQTSIEKSHSIITKFLKQNNGSKL